MTKDERLEELQLPKGLQIIADEIGVESTLDLADRFGGVMNYYIPRVAERSHVFAKVIGLPNWRKLCKKYGGMRLTIPRGSFVSLKKYAIISLAENGVSKRNIALRVRCSERYVYEVLRRLHFQGPPEQLDLF